MGAIPAFPSCICLSIFCLKLSAYSKNSENSSGVNTFRIFTQASVFILFRSEGTWMFRSNYVPWSKTLSSALTIRPVSVLLKTFLPVSPHPSLFPRSDPASVIKIPAGTTSLSGFFCFSIASAAFKYTGSCSCKPWQNAVISKLFHACLVVRCHPTPHTFFIRTSIDPVYFTASKVQFTHLATKSPHSICFVSAQTERCISFFMRVIKYSFLAELYSTVFP